MKKKQFLRGYLLMFVYCPSGQVSRLVKACSFFILLLLLLLLGVSFFLSHTVTTCLPKYRGRQNSGTGEYGETGTLGEMNDMRFTSCSTVTLLSVAPLAPFQGSCKLGPTPTFSPHQRQPVVPTPGSEKVPSPTPPSQCSHATTFQAFV